MASLAQNKRMCPNLDANFDQSNLGWQTDWLVGNGTTSNPQYDLLTLDFSWKWEKYNSTTNITTVIVEFPGAVISSTLWPINQSVLDAGITKLKIWPLCPPNQTTTPCPIGAWKQADSDLADQAVGGYMGDGVYTFTATRVDGCEISVSRNIILGCMDSNNPNYNSAATFDSNNFHSKYTMPASLQCI